LADGSEGDELPPVESLKDASEGSKSIGRDSKSAMKASLPKTSCWDSDKTQIGNSDVPIKRAIWRFGMLRCESESDMI
jgi:hypothetical protein